MATYRLGEHQRAQVRRYFVRAIGGLGVVQLGAGVLFGRVHQGLAFLAAVVAVAVFVSATARFSFTTLNDEGIRTRAFAFPRRSCPWSQVADIEVRRQGQATTVRVRRADGTRFTLGAPVTGSVMSDPMFHVTVEQITDAWRRHAPEIQNTSDVSRRAQVWRRFGIAATTTVLWVGLPFILLGAFLVAREDGVFTSYGHTRAVVVGVDTSYANAVYQLDAVPGSTFPASEIATSMTEAYCALIADGTRVGDRVELVYPRSDPGRMEDERLAPVWWHEALPPVVIGALGGIGSVLIRRSLTKTHRLRQR